MRGYSAGDMPKTACLALAIMAEETNFNIDAPLALIYPYPSERFLSSAGDTLGPMQMNWKTIAKKFNIEESEARKRLNTIDGGVSDGIGYLFDVIESYLKDGEHSVETAENAVGNYFKFIAADYNQGIDTCRKAALQDTAKRLLRGHQELQVDGDIGKKTAEALIFLYKYGIIKTNAEKCLIGELTNNLRLSYRTCTDLDSELLAIRRTFGLKEQYQMPYDSHNHDFTQLVRFGRQTNPVAYSARISAVANGICDYKAD